jgi:magnesium-transporting ATPase (P-type)
VLRNGDYRTLHHDKLHVGDVIMLTYGMKIPIDGICIAADQLSMDEAAMTGESEERRKDTIEVVMRRFEEKKSDHKNKAPLEHADLHDLPSPIILSGTSVAGGEGRMVGIVVGEISCLG